MTDTAPTVEHRGRRAPASDLMDEPAFADATEHQVKTPEPEAAAPKAPDPKAKFKIPDGWDQDMDGAPADGKPIWTLGFSEDTTLVIPDSGLPAGVVAMETVWRSTRFMLCGQWQLGGFWAVRNQGGRKLPYEAVAWRPAQ